MHIIGTRIAKPSLCSSPNYKHDGTLITTPTCIVRTVPARYKVQTSGMCFVPWARCKCSGRLRHEHCWKRQRGDTCGSPTSQHPHHLDESCANGLHHRSFVRCHQRFPDVARQQHATHPRSLVDLGLGRDDTSPVLPPPPSHQAARQMHNQIRRANSIR